MIALLTAFAVGTVLQSADATVMTAKMALAMSGTADAPDCSGCAGDGGDLPTCDYLCVAPFHAMIDAAKTQQPVVQETTADATTIGVAGRSGPPEPYPPRTDILI